MKNIRSLANLALLLLGVYSSQGQAAPFTDKTAFLNALPGAAGVLNFDSLAGGTDLSGATQTVSGGPGTGIVFPAAVTDLGGTTLHLRVVENVGGSNPTTSPANSLGTDDGGNFNTIIAGVAISLGFTSPVNAFGLSFITPDTLLDGDIRLIAGGETATLAVSDKTLLGNFGGTDYYAYFLGLTNGAGFSSANIGYDPALTGGEFLYNADDLTVAVNNNLPEPCTSALLSAGLLALAFGGRRRNPCGAGPDSKRQDLSKERHP